MLTRMINVYTIFLMVMLMAIGGVLAWFLMKAYKGWATRFMIVLAAGVMAGDSLTGVGLAVAKILGG